MLRQALLHFCQFLLNADHHVAGIGPAQAHNQAFYDFADAIFSDRTVTLQAAQ